MENGPFGDVFPIEHGDIPLLCYIVYQRVILFCFNEVLFSWFEIWVWLNGVTNWCAILKTRMDQKRSPFWLSKLGVPNLEHLNPVENWSNCLRIFLCHWHLVQCHITNTTFQKLAHPQWRRMTWAVQEFVFQVRHVVTGLQDGLLKRCDECAGSEMMWAVTKNPGYLLYIGDDTTQSYTHTAHTIHV